MSHESALFEEDFAADLGDLQAPQMRRPAGQGQALDPRLTDASAAEYAAPESHGGDRPIPAISIRAFYETPNTLQLLQVASSDRRMARADIDLVQGGIEAAIQYLSVNATPNLLLIESGLPARDMLAQIDSLAEYCDPDVQVMVVGAMNDITLYRQLVARGVSEYLVPPLRPVQLIRSIAELFSDPETPFMGKSVSVVGAKGGVGASTLAHNLAWSLAERGRVNTTLVDLDLSFGTTALDFNQEGAQSVTDALLAPDRADEAVVARLLTKVTDHLSLFTAPASINEEFDITPDAYDTVVQGVRKTVPYVVLDLPHIWSTWIKDTLIASDEVVLICQPDLASLRNGKNIIDRLKAERPNDIPPRLVLNMVGVPKRPEIPVKDFAAAIGLEPLVVLPFEPALFGGASNNGQMLSEAQADASSSLAIDHLAAKLTGQSIDMPQKSLIQKLLRK